MKTSKRWLAGALSATLALSLLQSAAFAESGGGSVQKEETAEAPTVSLTEGASFELMENVEIDQEATEGSFYLYSPSNPHVYDMLSSFLNGLIILYPDQPCQSEEDALSMLEELGLLEIAEEFPAYIAIANPINGESYTEADVDLYNTILYYLMGSTASSSIPATTYTDRLATGEHTFVFGEGAGATFINNYISQNTQYLAGVLTVGGDISEATPVGSGLTAYLVNPSDASEEYWKTACAVDTEDGATSYNSSHEELQVTVAEGENVLTAEIVEDAWSILRCTISCNYDNVERKLMSWPDMSEEPIQTISMEYDAETNTAKKNNNFLTYDENSVALYVPDAVQENPDEEVPVVMIFHGMNGDPIEMVESTGWVQKAVEENLILVAPVSTDVEYIASLLSYVKSQYSVDDSRVYATGFSMGGMTTSNVAKTYPELFAAITPMGSCGGSYVEMLDEDAYDMPICMITGTADALNCSTDENGNPKFSGMSTEAIIQAFTMNEIEVGEADYSIGPWGYEPDNFIEYTIKDISYEVNQFYTDAYSVPIVQAVTELGVCHTYTDQMANIAWEFMSQFARAEDGSVIVLENSSLPEGASFSLVSDVSIAGSSTGGSYYVYLPSTLHDFDILSNYLNGTVFLYPDENNLPKTEEDALTLIEELGLLEIAEKEPTCIVIPLPANGESWSDADAEIFREAQYYLAGGTVTAEGYELSTEYDRHTMNSLLYVIAEGSGTTFVNNVLSQNAGRIAGILTFGGEISDTVDTGYAVPAYLVDADEAAVSYWKEANGATVQNDNTFVNPNNQLKRVIAAEGADSFDAETIQSVWYQFLHKTSRVAIAENLVLATDVEGEWTLQSWADADEYGVKTVYHTMMSGDVERDVYDFIPSSVTGEEEIPLVLVLHGGSDDPLNVVYSSGWIQVAAENGFVMVSPDYSTSSDDEFLYQVVQYAIEQYPIDTSRIYVTGFSMGGINSVNMAMAYPELFAAMAPMGSTEGYTSQLAELTEQNGAKYDIPTLLMIGGKDTNNVGSDENGNATLGYNHDPDSYELIYLYQYNDVEVGEQDFGIEPYWGYAADQHEQVVYEEVHYDISSYYNEKYTNPVMQMVIIEEAGHNNTDYQAVLAWEFMSQFARNENGEIVELNTEISEMPFVDVQETDWYYQAVLWANESGITNGTDATHFSPDGSCDRATIVTFLWKQAGQPMPSVSTANPFTDVQETDWYYNAVLWTYETGMTNGTSETTFSPNQPCDRATIVTFLWKQAGQPVVSVENPFADVDSDAWWYQAVLWAVENEITTGTSATTFSPNAVCNRAQGVTFLWRMC